VAISSDWGDLSQHLIASFWAVDRKGARLGGETVKAPLLDANFEASFNWVSPFERVGEDFLPTVQQLLQSGQLDPTAKTIDKLSGTDVSPLLPELEGKTSVTKLNSTQVFNGMPPVKIPVTALFRAWKNPQQEVEAGLNQLMTWALPVMLAGDSTVISRAGGGAGAVGTLLPSQVPVFIAMKYKNRTYKPLVIESISAPISSSVDKNGKFTELAVQMQLATLTAIDGKDWAGYGG
jgi:hypothetical protein